MGRPESAARVNSNTGKDDGYWGLSWRGEEQLLYVVRNANATATIWQMKEDGSEQQQLHTANWIDGLSVPDTDRQLVFMQRSEGTEWRIAQLDLLTNELRELAKGGNAYGPSFEPHGQWVVYVAANNNKRALWKLATTGGGAPMLLNNRLANWPAVSPDGSQIAYHDREQEPPPKLAVMTANGGEPTKLFAYPDAIDARTADIRWTPDGRALTYIITRNGVSNLWQQPLDGSPPKQLTQFKAERIYRFDWSRAGKLALARGADQNDVLLIDGLK